MSAISKAFKKLGLGIRKKGSSARLKDEMEMHLHFLQDPLADEPHVLGAAQALQFLLEHQDQAYPVLLRLLKNHRASNPIAIIEALPKFGRPESIPVLEQILRQGGELLCRAAAAALAQHPMDSAYKALVRGLRLVSAESVIASSDGLMARRNPAACPELLERISDANDNVRFHVIQAAASLGCLSREKLTFITKNDPDVEIRNLASAFLNAG